MTEVTTYFKEPKPPPKRRAWNSTLPAPKPKKRATKITTEMRTDVYRRASGICQAAGIHHPDCPGRLPFGDWVPHHVHPREHGGPDTVGNLIAVWCPSGLGLNGCHGRIHGRPKLAETLGLLYRP